MHLRQALAAMWTDLKDSVRVAYARLHPEYDVLELGGEPVVFPPIDVDDFETDLTSDVESGFNEAMEDLRDEAAKFETGRQPHGQPKDLEVANTISGPRLVDAGIVKDRSQSMGDEDVEWEEGPLAQAMQEGQVLMLDEVNRIPSEKR